MMVRVVALLVIAGATAGCITRSTSYEDDFRAKFAPYKGRTVADFMRDFGHLPEGSADLAPGRRSFTFAGPAVVLSAPAVGFVPTVASAQSCRITVEASPQARAATATDWRIESITGTGPCLNF